MGMKTWLRGRKVTASIVAVSVLVGVPVAAAIIHQGFPVTDVELQAKDVWVTNGQKLLAGRLNRQIEELDASVATVSNDIDVLQNGDNVLMHDRSGSTVERIDPANVTLVERAELPPAAAIALGDTRLSVLDPSNGELWITDIQNGLNFSITDTKSIAKLGRDAQATVSSEGTVFAVSPSKKKLYTYKADGGDPVVTTIPAVKDFQLTAAGEEAVLLDTDKNRIITGEGKPLKLPDTALKIQQPSATPGNVIVATGSTLIDVPLDGGDTRTIKARITTPVSDPKGVSAPVNLNGCIHGAWAGASRYIAACDAKVTDVQDVEPLSKGANLVFRVNRNVIALNNIQSGDVWLVDSNMRLVKNWEEVTPPEEDEGEEGDEKASTQSFEDTIADRTDQNRPPLARDDEFGARPGKSTVLGVLDNDTDPDGDVLVINNYDPIPPETGTLDTIDGGRALQFTPNPNAGAGATASFRYSVSDGRPGGVAEANVNVKLVAADQNAAPITNREAATTVESGKSVTYNALTDWRDPDGDDIYLQQAASDAGDQVRFSPDGYITVTHTSGELGTRDIKFVVSDGTASAEGKFVLDVKPPNSLNPVGTPDYIETFVGEPADVFPLENDVSPSGEKLDLLAAESITAGLQTSVNPDDDSIRVLSGAPGAFYIKYTVGAAGKSSPGIIRVQVNEKPAQAQKPIAVRDIGYLRPNEPTSINVLTNDVSASGNVLAVRSVDVPDEVAAQLSVEVLNLQVIRVTTSAAVTGQLQFSYTVSDGTQDAVTTVTVVPIPPLQKHQAPIPADDQITVRAGDIVSVPVLDNDVHPDNTVMKVAPDLQQAPSAGLAFVADNEVRFQAPREAGTYTAQYKVTDEFEQTAVATVTFNVVAADEKNNQTPTPRALNARVFSGATVTVNIPLDGLDPDGDSVVYDGLVRPPSLGTIIDSTSTSITYRSFEGTSGTDAFEYSVRDTYGATATGTINIGVIARPAEAAPPKAVDDIVEVQPGRVVTVPVLANDSDPNGYELKLEKKLVEVPAEIEAKVSGANVEIQAPDEERTFGVQYAMNNGHGGTDNAFIQVRVTTAARLQPPIVQDHIVEAKDVVNKKTVDVDVKQGASNPGGTNDELKVDVEGPNAGQAEILSNGQVRVTLGDARTAIAYRLTNETDNLSTAAFIVVPPFSDGMPPELRPNLPEQIVPMNESRTWRLSDVAYSPGGKEISIKELGSVTSTNSDGSKNAPDDKTLTYTPRRDYRGPASITFEATDGTSTGHQVLTLPITVGDPEQEDVPPTFVAQEIPIEAGEAPQTVDLRAATNHPNPALIPQMTYDNLGGASGGIEPTLSGSTISVSAPFGVQPGTSTTLTFNVKFKQFTVPGTVTVRVVKSTRPLPSAVQDSEGNGRPSKPVTLNVLKNDFNPFGNDGKPLTIVDAAVETGNAQAAIKGENITVTPGPDKAQTISVLYTIEDATKDPSRRAQGRVSVTVMSEPDAPRAASLTASPRNITVKVNPSPSSNGSAITDYTVTRTPGGTQQSCPTAAPCTLKFAGENGQKYTFTVTATNGVGRSEASPPSSETSYDKPATPGRPKATRDAQYANTTISGEWPATGDTGGSAVTYNYEFSNGTKGSTTGLKARSGTVGVGSYTLRVQACNNEAGCSAWSADSNGANVEEKPPPPPPKPSVTMSQGGPKAVAGSGTGYHFAFTAKNFPPNTTVEVRCRGVDGSSSDWNYPSSGPRPGSPAYITDGDGNLTTQTGCYNGNHGDHWVSVNGVESNKVVW